LAIDRTARIHPKAELASDVSVGAYTVIDQHVRIGPGTAIGNHVTITGHTQIGNNNRIFHGAVLGSEPQDLKHGGDPTRLILGDDNVLREYTTINAGTKEGGGVTIIGNRNFLMACSHVAHDCVLEDQITMANAVLLGGHVKIEHGASISGGVAIHHFAMIGTLAFVHGVTGIVQDVPPYMVVDGSRNPRKLNLVGLRRAGIPEERINALEEAFRLIYRSGRISKEQALAELESRMGLTEEVRNLIDFLRKSGKGKKGRFLESARLDALGGGR